VLEHYDKIISRASGYVFLHQVSPAVGESVSSEAELVRTLKGHVTAVTSLAFSPSALLLVSGCSKGWMNIWALQVRLSAFTFY